VFWNPIGRYFSGGRRGAISLYPSIFDVGEIIGRVDVMRLTTFSLRVFPVNRRISVLLYAVCLAVPLDASAQTAFCGAAIKSTTGDPSCSANASYSNNGIQAAGADTDSGAESFSFAYSAGYDAQASVTPGALQGSASAAATSTPPDYAYTDADGDGAILLNPVPTTLTSFGIGWSAVWQPIFLVGSTTGALGSVVQFTITAQGSGSISSDVCATGNDAFLSGYIYNGAAALISLSQDLCSTVNNTPLVAKQTLTTTVGSTLYLAAGFAGHAGALAGFPNFDNYDVTTFIQDASATSSGKMLVYIDPVTPGATYTDTQTGAVNGYLTPPNYVPVPPVVGESQSSASAAIVSAGLIIGTVTQQPSMTAIAGQVISQNPAATATVADGSAVNLVVSSGSTCTDLQLVKAAFGSKVGQPAYNPMADVNSDGVVNIIDLSTVAHALPAGTVCN